MSDFYPTLTSDQTHAQFPTHHVIILHKFITKITQMYVVAFNPFQFSQIIIGVYAPTHINPFFHQINQHILTYTIIITTTTTTSTTTRNPIIIGHMRLHSITHFLKLLSASRCQCQVRCLCFISQIELQVTLALSYTRRINTQQL